ncbi:MAG: ATP-binding protein [bacterium]
MYNRKIWARLKEHLSDAQTIVITGPRRVGKTTTIKWLLSQINSENKYYFDLENVANRDLFSINDYDALLNEFRNLGLNLAEQIYIAIDEIQFVKNLPSIVKYLQDTYPVKFILSGSSSYYLKNLFSESLAGRKIIFELYPLTFSEFLVFKDINYQSEFDFTNPGSLNLQMFNKYQTYYDEYIEYGGLPQVVLAAKLSDKKALLEDAYSSYINLDVQSLSDFKSLDEFRKLAKLLAARVGSKLNTTELGAVLGISRITIDAYLEFMSKTYLIKLVEVFSYSADVQARKQEKVYFIDNGILNQNAIVSSGAKFENAIASQLAYSKQLNYFENRTKEIDFIVDSSFAIEAKETPTNQDLVLLQNRASELQLKNVFLVGKNLNKSFQDYIWGGQLG